MPTASKPKRGEIWLVSFDPQVGAEIQKTRPALVVGIDTMGYLPTRLVVPIRDQKPHHPGNFYYVPLAPAARNGLTKPSTLDCSQVKSLSLQRFVKRVGRAGQDCVNEVAKVLAVAIGYTL